MAFVRGHSIASVYVADIQGDGPRIRSTRKLTLTDYDNEAEGWTPDGKAIIFRSFRNGRRRQYKQALGSDTEEPLFAQPIDMDIDSARVSPDGTWLLYLVGNQLMRIPVNGGTPQLVLTISNHNKFISMFGCTTAPANSCVVAEQSGYGKPIVFTAFDPVRGRGKELARFETTEERYYSWALSPSGREIAILKLWESRIRILSLENNLWREVAVKGGLKLWGLAWAADGNGWFCSLPSFGDSAQEDLVYIDVHGNATRFGPKHANYCIPSPDRSHLAIVARSFNGNVWRCG